MNVGLMLYGKEPLNYVLADMLLRSVRRVMPGTPVVQLTDEQAAPLHGVDDVRRVPAAPVALLRTAHQVALPGEWLYLDADVVVQQDVRDVFADPDFDVALADREWPGQPHLPQAFVSQNPYNIGVCFSRSPAFWVAVRETLLGLSEREQQDWLADQRIAGKIAASGRFRVKILPGAMYNYPPTGPQDPAVRDAAVVHYKGNRKNLMLERFATI